MASLPDSSSRSDLDPRLPVELQECILQFLSPPFTSTPFPSTYSLISRPLNARCTSLLYKHIIIDSSFKIASLHSTLQSESFLYTAVKHLSIFFPLPTSPDRNKSFNLLLFQNLKTLSIESQSTSTSRESWKENFNSNRTDPYPSLFSPSLRSLTFGPDAFHWFTTTAKKDLIFKIQPSPLPFEDSSAINSDSYVYKNWTFGKTEDEEGQGLKLLHLHLYSPPMNSRLFTRLRTANCFPHLERLTISLPKVAHPDDLRLLKRTLKHLTDDHESAWVYGSKRTFSRGLRKITIRVWAGWVEHVSTSLGLREERWDEVEEPYDFEKLNPQELLERELKLRNMDPETRYKQAIRVEKFEMEPGNWRLARSEEFKRGGWLGDLTDWDWGYSLTFVLPNYRSFLSVISSLSDEMNVASRMGPYLFISSRSSVQEFSCVKNHLPNHVDCSPRWNRSTHSSWR